MEIYFGCKRFSMDQILRCAFGLTNPEFKVLKALLSKGEQSVEAIAVQMGKDRTTVQRSMKSLLAKELAQRRQYNLDSGGYQYYYTPQEKEQIKEMINDHFKRFSAMVEAEIERW